MASTHTSADTPFLSLSLSLNRQVGQCTSDRVGQVHSWETQNALKNHTHTHTHPYMYADTCIQTHTPTHQHTNENKKINGCKTLWRGAAAAIRAWCGLWAVRTYSRARPKNQTMHACTVVNEMCVCNLALMGKKSYPYSSSCEWRNQKFIVLFKSLAILSLYCFNFSVDTMIFVAKLESIPSQKSDNCQKCYKTVCQTVFLWINVAYVEINCQEPCESDFKPLKISAVFVGENVNKRVTWSVKKSRDKQSADFSCWRQFLRNFVNLPV